MTAGAPCPTCGRDIPAAAPGGLCPACLFTRMAPPKAEPIPSALPATFGPYEILGEIARGAMGRVLRARQVELDREVALKLIHAGRFADPELIERFRQEAGVAAQLDHPHIVPVLEFGEHDGTPFLAMRLLTGGSLRERIPSLAGRPREAVELLLPVVRAVFFAHQRGVIHRDLKPANILLDAEGRPHVADFGLAKLLEQDSGLSLTGMVLGSPSYMAPEQARGDSRQVSTASDIHGLGAILYHLLTGVPPYEGEGALETLRRVMEEEPVPPSRRQPAVDRDLEAITLKCLEKDPARRYASAEALATDLERWRDGLPVEARPAGPVLRLAKWARRRPGYATVAAVLAAGWVWVMVEALRRDPVPSAGAAAPVNFMGATVWVPHGRAVDAGALAQFEVRFDSTNGLRHAVLSLDADLGPAPERVRLHVWLDDEPRSRVIEPRRGPRGRMEYAFTWPPDVKRMRTMLSERREPLGAEGKDE